MAVSKVIYSGNTLIDLTTDTVISGAMENGYTAHNSFGNQITGNMYCYIEGNKLVLSCGMVQNRKLTL